MNAGIEELEQALNVMKRKLREHKDELERLIEKKPIVENNIKNTEIKILDIEASIFILKNMAEG
ncbi:hypothetical protein KHU47_27815 [Bacillus cereus]|uniref:hypothetical protein n=1 Tax=Bacillus cereus TaxID=1396 RepID=UPI001BDB183C|nr:hypothetical protein [Bacillus cereus]MBT0793181.1 hypothetical protein [Bacillus cereus]MDA2052068.1 hypothetical protein [Bacillus cereus]